MRASVYTAFVVALLSSSLHAQPLRIAADTAYTQHTGSPDGIGRFYMGREIARAISTEGAAWLERDSRVREERPDLLLQALQLKPTDEVADVGAGTGYYTFQIAEKIPKGFIVAADVQREFVQRIKATAQQRGIANVKTVTSTERNPGLPPAFVNKILMVDVYHELAYPRETLRALLEALKPRGYLFVVEFRAEDPNVLIKPLHKMSQRQVVKEITSVGFQYVTTYGNLPQQHVVVFMKP